MSTISHTKGNPSTHQGLQMKCLTDHRTAAETSSQHTFLLTLEWTASEKFCSCQVCRGETVGQIWTSLWSPLFSLFTQLRSYILKHLYSFAKHHKPVPATIIQLQNHSVWSHWGPGNFLVNTIDKNAGLWKLITHNTMRTTELLALIKHSEGGDKTEG